MTSAALMSTDHFAQARKAMVDGQLHPQNVFDPKILAAFNTVPRDMFVTDDYLSQAYHEKTIPLECGRYLLEPAQIARMIQEANISPNDNILVVADGHGYTAAILSECGFDRVTLYDHTYPLGASATCLFNVGLRDIPMITASDDLRAIQQADKTAPAAFDVILVMGAVAGLPELIKAFKPIMTHNAALYSFVRRDKLQTPAVVYQFFDGHPAQKKLFDAKIPFIPAFALLDEQFQF